MARIAVIAGRVVLAVFVIAALQMISHFGLMMSNRCESEFPNRDSELSIMRSQIMAECRKGLSGFPQSSQNTSCVNSSLSTEKEDIVVSKLQAIARELVHTAASLSGQGGYQMYKHLESINALLNTLGADTIPPQPNSIVETQDTKEVCPEKFMGKNLAYGYPYFRKGFMTLNCSDAIPFDKLVTVLIHYTGDGFSNMLELLKNINKLYPSLTVYVATSTPLNTKEISKLSLSVKAFPVENLKEGGIWQSMVDQVHTPYVLLTPGMTHFNDDINLVRLVRILGTYKNVLFAGGSYRDVEGKWDIGCQQMTFRNWTLSFKGGYHMSVSECVICDYMPGPFLAKTTAFLKYKLDGRITKGAFMDLFLQLKKGGALAVSCPDIMFYVHQKPPEDEELADFAHNSEIKKIVEYDGRVRWYGCRRGVHHRKHPGSCTMSRGLAVPPCDLENLADAIKLIMKECEEAGLFCELQEGSLLGAVKFNKILPWERDADLTFLTQNYTAFKMLKSKFISMGYTLSDDDGSLWCCADGRQAGGKFRMSADGWSIELYGQHRMESEVLAEQGLKPTKVLLAGQWVAVMRNPGLFARNRYGPGIYQHAEHWMDLGHQTGWSFYKTGTFSPCTRPGHSGCLDQYPADGNIQFNNPYC